MTVRKLDQLCEFDQTVDLSLFTEAELIEQYHNVYECGCDVCNEKLEAIAEEFFK